MVFSQLKHGGKFESSSYCSLVERLAETGTKNNKQHGNINMKGNVRETKISPPPPKRIENGTQKAEQEFPSQNTTRAREGVQLN